MGGVKRWGISRRGAETQREDLQERRDRTFYARGRITEIYTSARICRRIKETAFVYRVPWDMIKIWRLFYRNEVERIGFEIHDDFKLGTFAAE